MTNGDNNSLTSEEATVREGIRSTTKLKQRRSKSSNEEKYNQCMNERERLQEERKFILIFIQMILKHSKVDEQLKSNIRRTVQLCTRQNRITNQPLVPLLESKLRKIIHPNLWTRIETLAIEYYCTKMLK